MTALHDKIVDTQKIAWPSDMAIADEGRSTPDFGVRPRRAPSAYVPIDISSDFLWQAVEQLSEAFPDLAIYPVEGDFTAPLSIPVAIKSKPFDLNLLHRINRELVGSVPVDAFRHLARWNDAEARIEMHLEAVRDVHFVVDGRHFSIARGETIHTENSLKYGPREAGVLLRAGGWTPIADWTDDNELFSVILAKQGAAQSAPQPVNRSRGFQSLKHRRFE